RSHDLRFFAYDHHLTRPFANFVSIPGKRFLGRLKLGSEWNDYLIADALLGWRFAPNIVAYEKYNSLLITDRDGFVAEPDAPVVSRERLPETYRILVLGGSTVAGVGAPRPAQNIVSMMQREAITRGLTGSGKRLEFINAGVPGYHSGQSYLFLLSDLI